MANPFGAEAGAKILEQGGNAIDAAVAIAYALNVVEPQSAGIGGGGFMMIHLAATGQTFAIDTRETAPAGAARDMFVGVPNASLQGVAVGVPGMVRGTELAVKQYGRLSLAQVLQPAIELADAGFAATPRFVTSPNCTNRHQPGEELAAVRRILLPRRAGDPGWHAGDEQAAGRDLPADRAARRRLLLQDDAGQGLRHRARHRRRPEVEPPAGPRTARAAA